MRKKAHLKYLENVGIEDPETAKTLSFVNSILKHDDKQFNSKFPTKVTSHVRANDHLDNDSADITKEASYIEKDAADIMGGLRKLVSSAASRMPKKGAPTPGVSDTSRLRAINPNVDKMIKPKGPANQPVAFAPDKPQADIKTPQAGTAAIKANVPSEALRTDQQQAVKRKPETKSSKKTSVDGTPPVMTRKNDKTLASAAPNMTQRADATSYDMHSPKMTMQNLPTMANSAIQPNANLITPNVTTADLQSVKPVAPADGKRFGATPFDPNGTMKNRAVSPDIPRGAPTPPSDPRFGAVPFDPNTMPDAPIRPQATTQQQQAPTMANPPIQPQATPTLQNTPLQPQGPAAGVVQPNTQNINSIMGALGPQNANPMQPGMNMQGQAQGVIAPNTQEMNNIQGALGPQKQNSVDPNASAAQQAAQAQQQPKIVNNTMKPPAPPKTEPAAKAEPAAAKPAPGTKEKAQLEKLKQKNVIDKLHQRLQSLESAAKEKASAPAEDKKPKNTSEKANDKVTRKVEPAKPEAVTRKVDVAESDAKKTDPIKPKSESSTVAKEKNSPENDDSGKTRKMNLWNEIVPNMEKDEQAKKSRTQKVNAVNAQIPGKVTPMVRTAEDPEIDKLNQFHENAAKERRRFDDARKAAISERDRRQKADEDAKTNNFEGTENARTSNFDRINDGKTAPYDRSENAKTNPIRPAESDGSKQEGTGPNRTSTMNTPQKQTDSHEKAKQDNGEAQGRAQSGQGRDVNYAVGYTGDADKPKKQSIGSRISGAIKGKVEQIRGNADSKKPKSVQQMEAIPSKPHNVYTEGPKPTPASGEPKVNIPEGNKPKAGTSPITGNTPPNSPEGQSKIKEHLMGALGASKEEASKKWNSMSPEHQKGVMLGATLLATAGIGMGLSRRSKRKKEEARNERQNEMRQLLAEYSSSSGGYTGGGYGRY